MTLPHVLDRKFRGEVREASAPATQDIVITMPSWALCSWIQPSVSTALYKEALRGEGKLIVIAFVKEDGTTSMTLVLQNTLISSYNVSGHGGGDLRPTESLSINFTKMTFEMSPTSPDTTHSQVYQLSQQGDHW